VIRHQAVRDDPPSVLEDDPGESSQEIKAIEIVAHDRLTVVPTSRDVVVRIRLEDSQPTSHPRRR
jgi:hypothetical protein